MEGQNHFSGQTETLRELYKYKLGVNCRFSIALSYSVLDSFGLFLFLVLLTFLFPSFCYFLNRFLFSFNASVY